ncbi:MAG: ribosome recycling factor [Firmicutes bacterium]|nr:ribosome recycling factor [Bacillota bacterium]
MNIENVAVKAEFDKFEEKMKKTTDFYQTELGLMKAGRANKNLLEKIMVSCYGDKTPITQLANVSVPEARQLAIAMYDPSLIKEASKAILASDLGITPADDGKIIRLNFPALTEEKRRDLVKQTKKVCEECKVSLRNDRRDVMEVLKKFKKDAQITEDDLANLEKEVQKLLDKSLQTLEKMQVDKEKELMSV